MEHIIFNTDFVKFTKPAKRRDAFAESLITEVSTSNARSIESKARQQSLRVLLATACKNKGGLDLADIMGRLRFTDTTIRNVSSEHVLSIIPSDYFCDNDTKFCTTVINETQIYYDSNHLSNDGSLLYARMIEDQFSNFILK